MRVADKRKAYLHGKRRPVIPPRLLNQIYSPRATRICDQASGLARDSVSVWRVGPGFRFPVSLARLEALERRELLVAYFLLVVNFAACVLVGFRVYCCSC